VEPRRRLLCCGVLRHRHRRLREPNVTDSATTSVRYCLPFLLPAAGLDAPLNKRRAPLFEVLGARLGLAAPHHHIVELGHILHCSSFLTRRLVAKPKEATFCPLGRT
jgi:hypothetical protein